MWERQSKTESLIFKHQALKLIRNIIIRKRVEFAVYVCCHKHFCKFDMPNPTWKRERIFQTEVERMWYKCRLNGSNWSCFNPWCDLPWKSWKFLLQKLMTSTIISNNFINQENMEKKGFLFVLKTQVNNI